MTKIDYPRLCGGTFFVLLLQARKQHYKARNRLNGGSDGLSDTEVLKGLIRVFQPQYGEPALSTFPQNTSSYKSSTISYSTYLPFDDRLLISSFDEQTKKYYSTALFNMKKFINDFIDIENTYKLDHLVKSLLELIEEDKSIADSDLFYINLNGLPVNKTDISFLSEVHFQSFLFGIWHYIIVNRPNNMIGRSTYEQWHEDPNTPGKRWKFISKIGENFSRHINVKILDLSENKDDEKPDTKTSEAFQTSFEEQQTDNRTDNTGENASKQINNNSIVFNQFGNNNIQIANVEKLSINKN